MNHTAQRSGRERGSSRSGGSYRTRRTTRARAHAHMKARTQGKAPIVVPAVLKYPYRYLHAVSVPLIGSVRTPY